MKELDFEIKRMRLSSGDVVVLKYDAQITEDIAVRIRDSVGAALPADLGCKVLILSQGMEISVLEKAQLTALVAAA